MKKIKNLALIFIMSILVMSCGVPGTTSEALTGTEQLLPAELKGLKIYNVSTSRLGSTVKVAILNGNVNSTTYTVGKVQENCILINKQNNTTIEVSQILLENDSIIIAKKIIKYE